MLLYFNATYTGAVKIDTVRCQPQVCCKTEKSAKDFQSWIKSKTFSFYFAVTQPTSTNRFWKCFLHQDSGNLKTVRNLQRSVFLHNHWKHAYVYVALCYVRFGFMALSSLRSSNLFLLTVLVKYWIYLRTHTYILIHISYLILKKTNPTLISLREPALIINNINKVLSYLTFYLYCTQLML